MFNRSPGMHRTSTYTYALPEGAIAQKPAHPRDSSRLMALRGERIEHLTFRDFTALLRAGDVLVLNETRVIPARVRGIRMPTGGEVELLFLRPAAEAHYSAAATRWLALAKPGRRLRPGERVSFGALGEAVIVSVLDGGVREIELALTVGFEEFLQTAGTLPLPPYIHDDSPE